MSAEPTTQRPVAGLRGWLAANSSGNARAVIERGLLVIRRQNWMAFVSGFFEPVFYLFSMGLGVGALVGTVTGPNGRPISYAAFIAPALLATAAMNGAIYETTWNVFFRLHFARLYEGMLATALGPLDVALGEIAIALLRGLLYAAGFTAVIAALGLLSSWWALAMIPVALLIALGFSAFGMAVTSYFTTFQQMDWINIALLPMFLFSATLFPITAFPQVVQWFIMALPLWHGVELMRQLSIGHFEASTAVHLGYFVTMSVVGIAFVTRRLRTLFLR